MPLTRDANFRLRSLPPAPKLYLATALDTRKFHEEGVAFLAETGLQGNLYNSYLMGGFLAYRLAPRLRTFIDGRTEHYPVEVYRDHAMVEAMRATRAGESFVDVLERRRVDVFFGVGVPAGKRYTSAHLERVPGWLLVWRHEATSSADCPQ